MKTFSLRPEERKDLIKLGKQIKDVKGAIRVRVILALDAGYTVTETAKLFLLDEDTVNRWKKKYEKRQFFSDWLEEYYAGYNGKLTKEQLIEIEEFVDKHTVTDSREVVSYIKKQYEKEYSITGVTKLLHRLGFVYKQVVTNVASWRRTKERTERWRACHQPVRSDNSAWQRHSQSVPSGTSPSDERFF